VTTWYAAGEIDEHEARLIAFKSCYRHRQTDYEDRLGSGQEREWARIDAEPNSPIPGNWDEYLVKYGFDEDPVADALAGILQNPQQAHPVWFCEAVEAVKWFGLSLECLTYEAICHAISCWRGERSSS
jgi:hypothetical protein